jgi:para-nitrobenzyl esterase
MPRARPGVPGPGSNGSGFTTASEHASELQLQYIFNLGADFTPAQATLATDMKTYWANFVKTGIPGIGSDHNFPPFWLPFSPFLGNQIQLLTPQGPHPFNTFTTEHFCHTWQPLLAIEPQQP